jgi:DNA repair protein SbcD/Mre11
LDRAGRPDIEKYRTEDVLDLLRPISRSLSCGCMAGVTFLHAADIHLGRPFSGLLRSGPELGSRVSKAAYASWDRMVHTALDRRVDFLILSGDVFDSPNPPVRAMVKFRTGLQLLNEAGVPVFMCLGNHDPLRSFPDSLRSLPGLHLFGAAPESFELDQGLMISGVSFEHASVTENLVRRFKRDSGVDLAIGVVHANVSGTVGHQNYAPCALGDLRESGMDVWCLGHVHAARVLSQAPLVLYPGTSQGANVGELGPKGCWLVTVPERGDVAPEFIPLASVRWEQVAVDLADLRDADDVLAAAEAECSGLIHDPDNLDAVIVRIVVYGVRHGSLSRIAEAFPDLLELLSERLEGLPVPVYPESVLDRTFPAVDMERLNEDDGFLGDLLRLCDRAAADPESIVDLTHQIQKELSRTVSRGYLKSDLHGILSTKQGPEYAQLVKHAKEYALSAFVQLADPKE